MCGGEKARESMCLGMEEKNRGLFVVHLCFYIIIYVRYKHLLSRLPGVVIREELFTAHALSAW